MIVVGAVFGTAVIAGVAGQIAHTRHYQPASTAPAAGPAAADRIASEQVSGRVT
jgi:hypothetical protein